MRSRILGLLYLVLVAFVAFGYQDIDSDDIDAELETIEHVLRARNEAANQKREEEEGGLDLEKMSNDELQKLLDELENDDKRKITEDNPKPRGWRRFAQNMRRYPG